MKPEQRMACREAYRQLKDTPMTAEEHARAAHEFVREWGEILVEAAMPTEGPRLLDVDATCPCCDGPMAVVEYVYPRGTMHPPIAWCAACGTILPGRFIATIAHKQSLVDAAVRYEMKRHQRRVHRGDPLRIPADVYNTLLDLIAAHQRQEGPVMMLADERRERELLVAFARYMDIEEEDIADEVDRFLERKGAPGASPAKTDEEAKKP